jgi:formamidopyrimidine-DNA glycosylase
VSRSSRGHHALTLAAVAFLSSLGVAACDRSGRSEAIQAERLATPSRWGTPSVFTTAHRSVGDAFSAFFDRRDTPQQPFPFSHQIHLEKQLVCTDCHEGVERGPRAGLPSINTCMICHSQVATDRPLIQQLAAMQEKGVDLAWQRVYDYQREAHVRFDHAPHIRAKVECSTCHGNIATQRTAQRNIDMTMGFCVNCHRERKAPDDCLTCHF